MKELIMVLYEANLLHGLGWKGATSSVKDMVESAIILSPYEANIDKNVLNWDKFCLHKNFI